LDILALLRLDFGQIRLNLGENSFAAPQLAVLSTSIAFYDILARACAEIKISKFQKKIFASPFSPFLFFLRQ